VRKRFDRDQFSKITFIGKKFVVSFRDDLQFRPFGFLAHKDLEIILLSNTLALNVPDEEV
jgi:glutamine phosphoribosylpyrophosphate amidotransferase